MYWVLLQKFKTHLVLQFIIQLVGFCDNILDTLGFAIECTDVFDFVIHISTALDFVIEFHSEGWSTSVGPHFV